MRQYIFTSEKRACVMQIVFALVALVVGFVLLVKGSGLVRRGLRRHCK